MNQNPEQIARDHIDQLLVQSGWLVQPKSQLNLAAGLGVAVTEYRTDTGPVDYLLFIDRKPIGIIEAKKAEEGVRLTMVEDQSLRYAEGKLKYFDNAPLHVAYESTGEVTRFTDYRDPKPRSRPVFSFHRPETLQKLLKEERTLRARLHDLPVLPTAGLRDCQITAITNLEKSFRENRPKALIQMATGSGKTFTAITFIYRLLKFAKGKRILFLVDTKNLGEQAEQEFRKYEPQDDNRLFPELYGVTRLTSSYIPPDSQVYISTIQRLYSILKGTELDERDEEQNPAERKWTAKEPLPVVYNEKIPLEFFDFIVIDECHRSIYNLWKQVLDYFDAFQIGLTATPDNRTFGYFNQNLVCDYGYQRAVEDGVLVPYNVFEITTKITQQGSRIEMGEYVGSREKLTRRQFWNTLDEDLVYTAKKLDDEVVNPNQIRKIIQTARDQLPVIFPDRLHKDGRFEVPKMLIFAKSDSHADDIIHIVREEFAEENKFCKKITYRSEEDPKSVLQQFRNNYYPRIAVTVDMIATGTDIRPLEVLLFMRDVKSRTYYEQMKGRGTRTCSLEELHTTGTPAARYTKDHFVIIDAIGVERSQKTDSRPLEKKPGLGLKEVMEAIAVGQQRDEDLLTTLANRLLRLDKQINEKEKAAFAEKAGGKAIGQVVKELLNAYDADTMAALAARVQNENAGAGPAEIDSKFRAQHAKLIEQAVSVFNNFELRNYLTDVRKKYDQVIDHINPDEIVKMGWVKDQVGEAQNMIAEFTRWIEAHKNEITALQIFYGQPYRRRELTYKMISDLFDRLTQEKPVIKLSKLWDAYATHQDEAAKDKPVKRLPRTAKPKQDLTLLVSLVRKAISIDEWLTSYDSTVDRNFQEWVFKKQAGSLKFTEEQMQWLRMIKDYIAASFHITTEDFELAPFNAAGGLGKYYQLFKGDYEKILDELNEVLAA
ncbi:MAG: DEAD/DEAH box helicase family protein [Cyclobacteriaceae bacterium]|jgi:type I restriction enzyme R subunit